MIKLAADGAARASDRESFLHLAKNLRFSHHHRIQAGGNAEKMANGILVIMPIDVRSEQRGIKTELTMQETA